MQEEKEKFWLTAVSKGRICQWLVIVGCIVVSICGGFGGWLDKEHIAEIMKYAVFTAGGIEVIKQLLARGAE